MGIFDLDSPFKQDAKQVLDPMGLFPASSGGGSNEIQEALGKLAGSRFEQWPVQKLLPPSLRSGQTDEMLQSGIQGIGQLIQNPGGLNPNISDAINARVSRESEQVAGNFRGLEAQQSGAAARGNLPVSIKNALASALGVAQERAQREVRSSALSESEGLRRQDLGQTYNLMDTLLQFISSGRGQGISGLGAAGQLNLGQQSLDNQMAAQQSAAASGMASGVMSMFGGK